MGASTDKRVKDIKALAGLAADLKRRKLDGADDIREAANKKTKALARDLKRPRGRKNASISKAGPFTSTYGMR